MWQVGEVTPHPQIPIVLNLQMAGQQVQVLDMDSILIIQFKSILKCTRVGKLLRMCPQISDKYLQNIYLRQQIDCLKSLKDL